MDTMFDSSDGSDTEINFKANNQYAKNYDVWRQKELLNSLKTKYQGDLNSDEDTSSSDEDESDIELPDKVEMDFLKTLSSLKNKDPKIYDESVKFFDDTPIDPTVKKKKKEQTMFLKDYERQMLLEHGEKVFNEEDNDYDEQPRGLTYVQEQEKLKKSLKSALDDVEQDDEDENFGGIFQTRKKTKDEVEKEEASYKQWLKGQKDNLNNEDDETSLKPLKDHWNDPNLDDGEKFLRDYILNNRFKETNNPNYVPTYDEVIHEDEKFSDDEVNVDKQEEFEHKFNYRFEEPDQDFLKRYPRTVENSLRKTDDRRKEKRQELKERKAKEKQEKMEDIQKLKLIKKKEIEEKIKKLQEITGNTQVAFEDQDIDDDFDPDAHDKRMQALFNDEFYTGEEGDDKPEFPDLDEELQIERWDILHKEQINKHDDNDVNCEDEDFNMDCDYDPSVSTQDELIENSKGKKKRRRKSKFAKAVSDTKPVFDPNDKTYEEYLDEYYKLDCEDIVGGVPCRFKYRQVAPNDFGLTIEEILTANDKELNRWASIKKAMQYRPDHIEKYDQIAYTKKAQNEALKRKILPSLYAKQEEKPSTSSVNIEEQNMNNSKASNAENIKKNSKKKRGHSECGDNDPESKKMKLIQNIDVKMTEIVNVSSEVVVDKAEGVGVEAVEAKQLKKTQSKEQLETLSESLPRTKKKKAKQVLNASVDSVTDAPTQETTKPKKVKKKKPKAQKPSENQGEHNENISNTATKPSETGNTPKAKNKNKNKKNKANKLNASVVSATSETAGSPKKKTSNAVKKPGFKPYQKQGKTSLTNKSNQPAWKRKTNGKNKNKAQANNAKTPSGGISDARLQAFGIKPKKFKNKLKYGFQNSST